MAADALAYFYVIKYHIFKTEYIFDAFFFFGSKPFSEPIL